MDTVSTTNQALTGRQIADGLRALADWFERTSPERVHPDQALRVPVSLTSVEDIEAIASTTGAPVRPGEYTSVSVGCGPARFHAHYQVGDPTWTHAVHVEFYARTEAAAEATS